MYLAQSGEIRTSVDTIVAETGAHRSQVVAAVQVLRKCGYIFSQTGRLGGIWLAKLPSEITVSEVVQAMENDFHLAECFGSSNNCGCGLSETCKLKPALKLALCGFLATLDKITLQDLVAEAA